MFVCQKRNILEYNALDKIKNYIFQNLFCSDMIIIKSIIQIENDYIYIHMMDHINEESKG